MDPNAIAALVNLGVAGIGLYLFVTDRLVTKKSCDERIAAVVEAKNAQIATEKARGDDWKALALGTEKRLDQVVPVVATAVGAPVP